MADFLNPVIYLSSTGPNRGGAISATKAKNNKSENFFDNISRGEAILGSNTYWCGYVKNDNVEGTLEDVVMFLDKNTDSEDDEIQIALGTSGLNGTEQTIGTINTAPSNVVWSLAPTYNQGIFIGDLKPGDKFPFWFWRKLDATEKEQKANRFDIIIAFDPPAGFTNPDEENPVPSTVKDATVAVTGDWSLSSDAGDTVDNITSFSEIKLTVSTGDNSYEDSGDDWADITKPLRSNGRFMKMAFGNHDRREGTPQPELTNFYLQLMKMDKTYGSFQHESMLFVFMDVYTDYSSGSTQYNKIKQILEDAKNNNSIKWRFFVYHEPMYSSPSHYDGVSKIRDTYHKLLQDNKVDFAVNGHNHNYQRSFPLAYNSSSPSKPTLVQDSEEPNYTDYSGKAVIFMTQGSAGRSSHRSLDSQASFMSDQQDSSYGFSMFKTSEGAKKMTVKFIKNGSHSVFETFTVTK